MKCLFMPGWTSRGQATDLATAFFVPGRTHPCAWHWSSLSLSRAQWQNLQQGGVLVAIIVHNIRIEGCLHHQYSS